MHRSGPLAAAIVLLVVGAACATQTKVRTTPPVSTTPVPTFAPNVATEAPAESGDAEFVAAACGVQRWWVKTGMDPDITQVAVGSPRATTIAYLTRSRHRPISHRGTASRPSRRRNGRSRP